MYEVSKGILNVFSGSQSDFMVISCVVDHLSN